MSQQNHLGQLIGSLVPNWQQAARPDNTILQGRWCRIEPLELLKHARALFEALHENDTCASWTYLPYGPFEGFDEFSQWLSNIISEQNIKYYAICDPHSALPVGAAAYLNIVPENGSIEIGHLHFSIALKKKPAATEAMYLMMKNVFEVLGYRRYEWKCNVLNEPSIQAAKRLGFRFEGVFRQHMVTKGHNRDTAWFSIVDSEWPVIKARLEAWLAPENFDFEEKQKKRLCDY